MPADELPGGWEYKKLGALGNWGSGGTPKRTVPAYYGGDIPWLKIGDLSDGPVSTAETHITRAGLDNSSAKLIPPGALLIAMYGSIGKLGITQIECATNQAIAHLLADENIVTMPFLYWRMLQARQELIKEGKGGAQQNISQTVLKAFRIGLPPLPEQRRIVARLDAIEAHRRAAKEKLDRLPALLDRYRQSVLAAAFRGDLTAAWRAAHPDTEPAAALLTRIRAERRRRWTEDKAQKATARAEARAAKKGQPWTDADRALRLNKERAKAAKTYTAPDPVDPTGLPDLPDGWVWVTVDDLSFIDVGFAFPSKKFAEEGVRLLRGANIAPGELDWTDSKFWPEEGAEDYDHLALREGDTVLAMDRPVISTGLKVARVTASDLPAFLVQRVSRFDVLLPMLQDLVFLSICSYRFISHLTSNQTGSDLPHVSAKDIGLYPIPLPPENELQALAPMVSRALAQIDALIEDVKRRGDVIDTLRQATLARAFRGELVPTDADLAASA